MSVRLLVLFFLSVSSFVRSSHDGIFDTDNDIDEILTEGETDLFHTPTTTTTTTSTTTMTISNVTLGQTDQTPAGKIHTTAANTAEALKILSGVIAAVASFYAAMVSLLKYKLKYSTRRSLTLGLADGSQAQSADLYASSIPVTLRTGTSTV